MTLSPKVRQRLSVVFGLVSIAGIAWGIYSVAKLFWSAFTQLNPTVAAGILAAATTVVVSVVSVLISKHLEQRNNVLTALREKKAPVYEELLEFIFRTINGDKMGLAPLTEAEVVTKFSGLTQRLIVWGSDDVVKALNKFRRYSVKISQDVNGAGLTALAIEELFLEIRKDLGHDNKGLTPGVILGTFINDLHNLFKSNSS
jgi:hypothetical protein